MISLARFDLPAALSGWEGAGIDLVRIVDPRGEAIAWLAPRFGGACVGFAIRQANLQSFGDGWLHALVSGTPDLARSQPKAIGCVPIGDAVLGASWDLVERDPTGALLGSAHHGLVLTAEIDGGVLHLSLTAAKPAGLTLGFAVTIARISLRSWEQGVSPRRTSIIRREQQSPGDSLEAAVTFLSQSGLPRRSHQWNQTCDDTVFIRYVGQP